MKQETSNGSRSVAASKLGGITHVPRARLPGRYASIFVALFSLSVFFNLTDLWSTSVALKIAGLGESNYVLIAIGNYLGLSVIGVLGLTKLVFVMGCFWAALYGIRTKDPVMRKRTLIVLSALVAMLIGVSLNNLYWIGTV